jgi:pimeloyl-ACP methyl ester carboxylesterase
MAMAERFDSILLLQQIVCPAHIIVGELDLPTPPADARLMAERIPNARLAVIPEAGHLSNLEQPELFNEAIRSFGSNLTR